MLGSLRSQLGELTVGNGIGRERAADHKEQNINAAPPGLLAGCPRDKGKADLAKSSTFNNSYNYDNESDDNSH